MKSLLRTIFALLLFASCAYDRQAVIEIDAMLARNTDELIAAIELLEEGTVTSDEVVAEVRRAAQEASAAVISIGQRSTARNLGGVATTAVGMLPGGAPVAEIVGGLVAAALAVYAGKRGVAGVGAKIENRAVERVHRERNSAYNGDELAKRKGGSA